MCSQMASGPPPEPPTARLAAVNDAIEAWSVFEQFFVLSYRSAPGIPSSSTISASAAAAILGISPDSVLNDSELFARLLHPDDRDRVLTEHWDAAANGEPLVSEYRMVSQDGTVLWIYDKAVPVIDGSGADHALWELPRHHATRQDRGGPEPRRGARPFGCRQHPGRRLSLRLRRDMDDRVPERPDRGSRRLPGERLHRQQRAQLRLDHPSRRPPLRDRGGGRRPRARLFVLARVQAGPRERGDTLGRRARPAGSRPRWPEHGRQSE